jgi:myo-inositol-1(or 4)-monophosphatase
MDTMLDFAIDTARRAGVLLLSMFEGQRDVQLKSTFELVTDADHASEALVISAIGRQFPDHAIVAEESGGTAAAAGYTWLIDPLDGTNNYAHGLPIFSVSLALLRDGALLLGVIYDPTRDELFAAESGQGARCNGRRIRVSESPNLAASLLATGFPYDYATNPDNNAREFTTLVGRVQGVRRLGSAALDLAYVAMGRFDAFWELRLSAWDVAAGSLLVEEAGGRITGIDGRPMNVDAPTLVASNGKVHDAVLRVLAQVRG